MTRYEELIEKFKERGYKMTPQRRAILRAIVGPPPHPTAEQIYEAVRDRMPDTSLATVYNTLRELVAIGEAQELELGHGVRRYEIAPQEHAHVVCVQCGCVWDMDGDFSALRLLFPSGGGFSPLRYTVTIYGRCSDCSALGDESGSS